MHFNCINKLKKHSAKKQKKHKEEYSMTYMIGLKQKKKKMCVYTHKAKKENQEIEVVVGILRTNIEDY